MPSNVAYGLREWRIEAKMREQPEIDARVRGESGADASPEMISKKFTDVSSCLVLVASRKAKILRRAARIKVLLLIIRDGAPHPRQIAQAHSELALDDRRVERVGDGGIETEDIFLSDLERYPAGGAVTCRDEGDLLYVGVSQEDRGDVHRVGDGIVDVRLKRPEVVRLSGYYGRAYSWVDDVPGSALQQRRKYLVE